MIRISTIEGPRHVTKGSATIADYGRKRRSMISRRTWIGRRVHGLKWWQR